MKILQVNRYHYIVGGAENYYFDLSKLLVSRGHKVAYFAMKGKKNVQSEWNKYFVSNISFQAINIRNFWKVFLRMVYSFEARKKLSQVLDEFKPDIVHIHNIYYHMSPSILLEFKKRKIPVVYTVHDYHLLTPNITYFHNSQICKLDYRNSVFEIFWHKCVRGSFVITVIVATVYKLHDLLGIYKSNVDSFISPSKFIYNKIKKWGSIKQKYYLLPYFLNNLATYKNKGDHRYVLFLGQISEKKGVRLLFEVAKLTPKINYKVVGGGNDEKYYENLLKQIKIKNVEIISQQNKKRTKDLLSYCSFLVMPSVWWEVSGISALEAFASGKPVVASNIGGIPENVINNFNGLLFEPGNLQDFKQKILRLWNDKKLINKLGKNAKNFVHKNNNPEEHFKKIMEIYRNALS